MRTIPFILVLITTIVVLHSGQATSQTTPVAVTGISDYFKAKHVVDDARIRRLLSSNKIPDSSNDPSNLGTKDTILGRYMGSSYRAQPNPANPAGERQWRGLLTTRNGNTRVLESERRILDQVRRGTPLGPDGHGNILVQSAEPIRHIKHQPTGFFPPGRTPNVKFTNDGGPTVRRERLIFGVNPHGQVSHFESGLKHTPPRPSAPNTGSSSNSFRVAGSSSSGMGRRAG